MTFYKKLDLQQLRKRARVIIYVQILWTTLSIIRNTMGLNKSSEIVDYTSDGIYISDRPQKRNWDVLIPLVTSATFLLTHIYVLMGISKNKHQLLLPWLIIDGILLAVSYTYLAIAMYLLPSTIMIVAVCLGLLCSVLDILMWLIVFELYQRLKENDSVDTSCILGDTDQNNSNPPTLSTYNENIKNNTPII